MTAEGVKGTEGAGSLAKLNTTLQALVGSLKGYMITLLLVIGIL